jgi:hypothetical protein
MELHTLMGHMSTASYDTDKFMPIPSTEKNFDCQFDKDMDRWAIFYFIVSPRLLILTNLDSYSHWLNSDFSAAYICLWLNL